MIDFPQFTSSRIFPAIDVRGGRCVRLVRGARDAELFYDADPVAAAERWEAAGAECLHVIDLGAAFGEDASTEVVLRIARTVKIPVQTGGGIRSPERVDQFLNGGIGRVILGTRALREPAFLREMIDKHGVHRIVVALDCQGDEVRVAGWEEASALSIEATQREMEAAGGEHFLVTATDRDGTLGGVRIDLVERVLAGGNARVVAAGGVGTLEHVEAVLRLRHPRLEGVVIGRALYDGTVNLEDALRLTESGKAAD